MIIIDGVAKPNLVEWVVENARDIERVEKELQDAKTLLGFDIKVIGVQEVWEEPTGIFEYGDAILVGPEGGPYVFHIYTRSDDGPFWLNFGEIGIQGPQGIQGPKGDPGEPGTSTRWYVGNMAPTGPDLKEGDCWLDASGTVHIYDGAWQARVNIKGIQGIQGPEGKQGKQGIQGPAGPQGPAGSPSPVVNILGVVDSVNQLPDISEVPENAGYLIQFEGTNRLYIVINGVWTNSGTWGGGSSVYADNEYQEYFNADTKLSVQSDYPNYGVIPKVKNTGTFSNGYMYLDNSLGAGPAGVGGAACLPTYWVSGTTVTESKVKNRNLITGTPTQSAHAANKAYVDAKIAQAHGDELIRPMFIPQVGDAREATTVAIPLGLVDQYNVVEIKVPIVDIVGGMNGVYNSLLGSGGDPSCLWIHNTGQQLTEGTYCGFYILTREGGTAMEGTCYIEGVSDGNIYVKFNLNNYYPFQELYIQYVSPHSSGWYFS